MNIKLHTPKSLKAGSGMSSIKQFLLSLLATTISIVLTFGTAAIIDNQKKQKEKREIVMMVMYDMDNSMKAVEEADSMIKLSMQLQLQLAENPVRFDTIRFHMARLIPMLKYTETTERIFSSSIETINTVGNVLFTENVAEFYQNRQLYKTTICDSITTVVLRDSPYATSKGILDFSFFEYALLSRDYLMIMRHLYAQCIQMMDVSEEEIEAYRKERERMEQGVSDDNDGKFTPEDEVIQLQRKIEDAKVKLKME